MMKALRIALMLLLLLAVVPGCGSDKDKGVNRGKDMPRAAPPKDAK